MLPTAFAFADFGPEPRPSWFFERGDFMARNEKMELGFLTVLTRGRTAQFNISQTANPPTDSVSWVPGRDSDRYFGLRLGVNF